MHMTARMHAVDQWKHQTVPWKHAMCTEAAVEVTSRSMEHSGKHAADHSNSAMEAQAIVAVIQQQQIIATVPWKHRL